jgi:hypothetical protein
VLGSGPGYPPGPGYAAAVSEPEGMLLKLRTSGVEVHATKTTFIPPAAERTPGVSVHPASLCTMRIVVASRGEARRL